MPQKILIGLWLLGLHLLSAEASSSFRTARLRNLLGFGIGTDLGTPPPTMAPTMGSVSLGIVPTAGTTPPVTVGTTVGTTPPVTVGTTPPITVGPTAPVTADTAWNPNEYTFQYKIYTNSTDHVAEVVDSVDKAAIESLQFLFTTQSNILASDLNMSNHATLKNVSSRVLGTFYRGDPVRTV